MSEIGTITGHDGTRNAQHARGRRPLSQVDTMRRVGGSDRHVCRHATYSLHTP